MRRELTLSVMVLACASGAHAQLGRTQDWNTFGGDIGRTGMERTDPFLNKESVAKDFGLLYKVNLDENGKGHRAVTPPVVISILTSDRGLKDLAVSATTHDIASALHVAAAHTF